MVVCTACEHDLPANEFWPVPLKGDMRLSTYKGRMEICRYCAAAYPPEQPEWKMWDGTALPPESLRERLKKARKREFELASD